MRHWRAQRHALIAGIALFVGFAVAAPREALGQTPPAVAQDLRLATSGTYTLDGSHTGVNWRVSHMGLSAFAGRFDRTSGQLRFDAADPVRSSLEVSIEAGSLSTPVDQLTAELRGVQWFNIAAHPAITFRSTQVERLGEARGRVTGDLTMNGMTMPVTLDVTWRGVAENPFSRAKTLGFSVRGQIRRSEFGIAALVPMIGDDVDIEIEAEFALR